MGRKQGSLNWSTLAKWDNQAIYEHFLNDKKYTPQHAFWSVRKVRQNYDANGNRLPREQYVSPDFWKPSGAMVETPVESPVQTEPVYEVGTWEWAKARLNEGQYVANCDSCVYHIQNGSLYYFDDLDREWCLSKNTEGEHTSGAPFTLVSNPEATETEVEQEQDMAKSDNAADALAQLIAPAMAGMVSKEIEKAVAKLHENMAPVKTLVVVKDKVEIELGQTNHVAAPKVIQLVNQGLNCMLVGPAGCGKTMLAETVAKALNRSFTLISCSAGMSEAQLLGRLLPLGANGAFTYVESPFMRAYANGGVILLDELDAADANLLLVINAALANGGVSIEARAALGPDASTYVKRHPDTVVIAVANTWGGGADTQYIGRGALDVSTLDRFYRLAVDYDETLEASLGTKKTVGWVQKTRKKAQQAKLRRVVSTRMITRIEKALAAGLTFDEATSDELSSWTLDERNKVA